MKYMLVCDTLVDKSGGGSEADVYIRNDGGNLILIENLKGRVVEQLYTRTLDLPEGSYIGQVISSGGM